MSLKYTCYSIVFNYLNSINVYHSLLIKLLSNGIKFSHCEVYYLNSHTTIMMLIDLQLSHICLKGKILFKTKYKSNLLLFFKHHPGNLLHFHDFYPGPGWTRICPTFTDSVDPDQFAIFRSQPIWVHITYHYCVQDRKDFLKLSHLLPDLAPWLTLSDSNYPYFEQISVVPLQFDYILYVPNVGRYMGLHCICKSM